jgi:Arc/MetJ family transcription regulator
VRTNVEVEDELLERARSLTGIEERTALVHAALRVLIERESARRLAWLGGSDPELRPIRRRVCNEEP